MKGLYVGVYSCLFILILLSELMFIGNSFGVQTHHHTSITFQEKEGSKLGHKEGHKNHERFRQKEEELRMELYPTGSTLPDCSHACGPCFPCKRVMVSFKCSAAESCPVVYRCLCKGKYYHVPSNV